MSGRNSLSRIEAGTQRVLLVEQNHSYVLCEGFYYFFQGERVGGLVEFLGLKEHLFSFKIKKPPLLQDVSFVELSFLDNYK
jgi:hypothetical protein